MNEGDSSKGHVTVLGGSGFIGRSVVYALSQRGWEVRALRAPRFNAPLDPTKSGLERLEFAKEVLDLSKQIAGSHSVINAAGDSNSSSTNLASLIGANAVLPVVVARAAAIAGVSRFVQVSSGAVQGDKDLLDSSQDWRPFSPYSISKSLGEVWLLNEPSTSETIIYRPASVHGPGRPMTEKIRNLAASKFSCVAGDGSNPTPQALVENVGDAIAFLATTELVPPLIVHHPWEGLTATEFLSIMGDRVPRKMPVWLTEKVLRGTRFMERYWRGLAPNRRRLEILLSGQQIAPSWLEASIWTPPQGTECWIKLRSSSLRNPRSSAPE